MPQQCSSLGAQEVTAPLRHMSHVAHDTQCTPLSSPAGGPSAPIASAESYAAVRLPYR